MKKKLIISLVLSVVLSSCTELAELTENIINGAKQPPLEDAFLGAQKANTDEQFILRVLLYKDGTSYILSGNPRYVDGEYVKGTCDQEYLSWNKTEEGFVLTDPSTGDVLYTAVSADECWTGETSFPNKVFVTWSHSAGETWDALSETHGWQQSMTLDRESEHLCEAQ